jgi:hypothetical protein
MTKDEALKLAMDWYGSGNQDPDEFERLILSIVAQPEQDGKCKRCTDGCPACDARKLPEQEPVQVSPLEFVEMVMEKEHLIGKPIFWAEWPNKEKNT